MVKRSIKFKLTFLAIALMIQPVAQAQLPRADPLHDTIRSP